MSCYTFSGEVRYDLHATDIALAEAQRLAIERYRDIKVLEQRLNDT